MKTLLSILILNLCGLNGPEAFGAGGTTAGGGGLVNPSHVTMEAAKLATADSRSIILNYLWEARDNRQDCDKVHGTDYTLCTANKKLFFSNPNVYKVLENVVIDFREDDACHDALGNPVDGSIYGVPQGHICISGLNLTSKLDEFFYEPQIIALVLHELSHLTGTTEEEAVALQTQMIEYLHSISVSTLRQATDQMIYYSSFDSTTIFLKMAKPEDTRFLHALCTADQNVSYGARGIMENWNKDSFRMISDELRANLARAMYRVLALSDLMCMRTVTEAMAQGKNEEIANDKAGVDRALHRYANLKGKGEMPLVDYIQKPDPLNIANILFDLTIPETIRTVSESDFPGALVEIVKQVDDLEIQVQKDLKGKFKVQ